MRKPVEERCTVPLCSFFVNRSESCALGSCVHATRYDTRTSEVHLYLQQCASNCALHSCISAKIIRMEMLAAWHPVRCAQGGLLPLRLTPLLAWRLGGLAAHTEPALRPAVVPATKVVGATFRAVVHCCCAAALSAPVRVAVRMELTDESLDGWAEKPQEHRRHRLCSIRTT